MRAAINNAGFGFPTRRLTVNLAPAEVRKEGTGYDLTNRVPRSEGPIGVGQDAASG